MIEFVLNILVEVLFALVWRFVLWPVAVIAATPVVVLYAFFSMAWRQQRFAHSLADTYSSLFSFWDWWAF